MEQSPAKESKDRQPSPDTFLTQFRNRRGFEVDQSIPNAEQIQSLYNELNNCVMGLDQKVGSVLRKHELEFLNEYKNRMYNVQKQMRQLKDKANEEENRRRKAQKIAELESERDNLRNKAEQLDKVCKDYKKGVDKWKQKAEALEDDRKFLEEQIIAAKKQNQRLQDQLGYLQKKQDGGHVNALAPDNTEDTNAMQNEPTEPQVWVNSDQSELGRSPNRTKNISSLAPSPAPQRNERYFENVQNRFKSTLSHLRNQLEAEKRTLRNLRATKTNYLLEKGELEDLFLECVEEVKKDILQRKQKTARLSFRGPKHKQSVTERQVNDLNDIKLEDFKEIDKRRVIELFISQQTVKRFLYDKMFVEENQEEAQ